MQLVISHEQHQTKDYRAGMHNVFEGYGHKQMWNLSGGPQWVWGLCLQWVPGAGQGIRGQSPLGEAS